MVTRMIEGVRLTAAVVLVALALFPGDSCERFR
jgi:hypothetical protein